MRKILTYTVFGILGLLLLLTLLYESGSSFAPCQAWGSFITGGQGYGGMHAMHGYRGGFGFLGFRGFGLAFWVLVGLLIYLLLRDSGDNESAIEILNKRLARGEITREDYLKLKREIIGDDSSTEEGKLSE